MSKYKITVKVKKQHKKFKKLKKQINNLKINSEEMSEELCRMIAEAKIRDEEMRYMQDFIRWKIWMMIMLYSGRKLMKIRILIYHSLTLLCRE